jgi:archaellum component FlaD/FlaE
VVVEKKEDDDTNDDNKDKENDDKPATSTGDDDSSAAAAKEDKTEKRSRPTVERYRPGTGRLSAVVAALHAPKEGVAATTGDKDSKPKQKRVSLLSREIYLYNLKSISTPSLTDECECVQ